MPFSWLSVALTSGKPPIYSQDTPWHPSEQWHNSSIFPAVVGVWLEFLSIVVFGKNQQKRFIWIIA